MPCWEVEFCCHVMLHHNQSSVKAIQGEVEKQKRAMAVLSCTTLGDLIKSAKSEWCYGRR